MTYKELQTALKSFKSQGLTDIKLNATKIELQAEYDRLTATTIEPETTEIDTTIEPEVNPTTDNEIETATSEIVIDEPLTITPGSFRDIIRQRRPLHRYRHPKSQGFQIVKPEKRYDQLTHDEWLGDTLAFLNDMPYDEYDYMAA